MEEKNTSENDTNISTSEKNAEIIEPNSSNPKETIIQNLETENMEVHHHPDLHHKPKKWKEYILEFLMIFLAVTMGFIAENIREHITEQKNAKILAQSLLDDIKQDTLSLHSLIDFSQKKLSAADSILSIVHTSRTIWNAKSFYTYITPMVTSIPFKSTDGTYSQMKTSGTLRYFKQSLVNIINAYAVQLKKTEYRDEVEDKGTWLLGNLLFDFINLEVITDMRLNKPVTHNMFIRINDEASTDKFINLIALNKGFRYRSFQEYKVQLKFADQLIESLKKEFNLD